MNAQVSRASISRHFCVWGFLFLCFSALSWRLTELQVFEDDFLQDQGDRRAVRTVALPTYRGMIRDRNGEPLAVSTPVKSIWVNPMEVDVNTEGWHKLCKLLDVNPLNLAQDVQAKQDKTFLYVRRHIPPALAQNVLDLHLNGVYAQQEFRRYYPMGEVTAQVLGTTNIDQVGLEGMELAFNTVLTGTPGEKTVVRDRQGHQIEKASQVKMAKPGEDITLSIDSRIQYLAYKELLKTIYQQKAKSGTVVVLDATTFEVLAMASAPSYNPNNSENGKDSRRRNRGVTDQFEPGSLMKPFSMAAILASGDVYPQTMVNTAPGWVKINGQLVRDHHNLGQIDATTVIKKSSNVGISKLTIAHPAENLYRMLETVGFGERTGSNFPGEVPGKIQYDGKRNPFVLATLAFGYGISTTPLQLAQAYGILAAQGMRKQVSFIKKTEPAVGEQVIPPAVAQALTQMMVHVTDRDGTAFLANVPGYTVAGKTGTARKVGTGGYEDNSHLASFAGYAPAYDPKLVVVVMIDEPKASYYGGQVAAPLFSTIMQGALRLLDIPPYQGPQPRFILARK